MIVPMGMTLRVEGLKTHFFTRAGIGRAVDGISFDVAPGQIVGIVGESGCGKSVTGLSIMLTLQGRSLRAASNSRDRTSRSSLTKKCAAFAEIVSR